ncbi:MAG: phosphonopyruvate decarboxylase [Nitrospinota bacterium]|nr:MAG: phosphonopyruvate decarboxylase [Nitrospinota bacterium]
MNRPEALKLIAELFPDQPIVLTLGGTVREMMALVGRRANHLPILDSMGLPVPIALGLALGLEEAPVDKVIVIEGDGSLLMGLSVLSTIGMLQPRKLLLILMDNGVYAATGGQPTAAQSTDFVRVAQAFGLEAREATTLEGLRSTLQELAALDRPAFLRVAVTTETIPTDYFLEDPVIPGREFQAYLQQRLRQSS